MNDAFLAELRASAPPAPERLRARVEAIAARMGFANRHHFTRVFSALMGIAPGAYRKRHSHT